MFLVANFSCRKIRLETAELPVLSDDDHEEKEDEDEEEEKEEEEEEEDEDEEESKELQRASPPEVAADEKTSRPDKRKRDAKTSNQGSPSVRTREGRKRLLKKLLNERGLPLREDSRLCEQYLRGGTKTDVTALADIMQEMDWYFKSTGYSSLARTTPSADAKFVFLVETMGGATL